MAFSSPTKKTSIKKTTGKFKTSDGVDIYYELRGEGAPIVFVYGLACQINHWNHQIHEFSKNYQTLVFDFRGHHKSSRPLQKNHMSLDWLTTDLLELVQELKLNKPLLVGHSLGAPLLLKAYQRQPDLFSGLVFINGFAKNPIRTPWNEDLNQQALKQLLKLNRLFPQPSQKVWEIITKNPLMGPISTALGGFNFKLTAFKNIEIYWKGVSSIDVDVFLKLFGETMKFEGSSILKTIHIPTLIIGGENDGITPPKYQIETHEEIPGSELLIIPYGSHCCQLDFPDYVNLRIEKFIQDHGLGVKKRATRKRKAENN